jgi:hypothetical protein
LNRLDILSRKAEHLGQISAAVRGEELIGKHRGMFVDRQVADVGQSEWLGRIGELKRSLAHFSRFDHLRRHRPSPRPTGADNFGCIT